MTNQDNQQYFTNQPTSDHDVSYWDFDLLNHKIKFKTDAGVFSKKRVDFGTVQLIQAAAETDLIVGPILDLGTGYGPVGISFAKNDYQVTMSDVNQRALELAKTNAEENGVINRVTIIESDVYSNIDQQFAAIIVNPPIRAGKKIIRQMIEEAPQYLLTGGKFIFVVQKKQGAESYKKIAEDVFSNIELLDRNKGYIVYSATKKS